ncbi:MAG: bifunctional alpha,alpha-trehalose-phosphate synthase (UDP-forming)/trehalose-phosphatase [Chloroflexota bacterium]
MIIVSNRLPFSVVEKGGEMTFGTSIGGLISGLSAYLSPTEKNLDWLWVGWPGINIDDEKQDAFKQSIASKRAYPVFISEEEMDKFYYGFCNSTIWPLFHYFLMHTYYEQDEWEVYKEVNERFAEAVLEVLEPADIVWIHDYHLMLLPQLIREKRPDATIGFFLHTPFPGFELFRLMPRRWGQAILRGLLGADLIGFHTHDYTQDFLRSVLRILGYEHKMGRLTVGGRLVKVDTFPMGVDFDRFHDAATTPEVEAEIKKLRSVLPEARIILSIDRLDYTKGISSRLRGFELFLKQNPQWHKKAVLTLVVVPSKVGIGEYRETKEHIEEAVENINAKYGTAEWVPVRYEYAALPFEQVVALYSTSQVALVTPLRDGMNLIAKEYVASRADNAGVLILSEMAGAAKELGEALLINPNSTEEIAEAIKQALEMPLDEQKRRNAAMQKRLRRYNVVAWAKDFVREMNQTCIEHDLLISKVPTSAEEEQMLSAYRGAARRLILLDYDGTLVAFSSDPQAVKPSERVLDLLSKLCADPRNEVVVISGRDRHTLEAWLGHLPMGLVAEHGAWVRYWNDEWAMSQPLGETWKPIIRPVLELFADRLPGAFIEEKEFSLVWHYRATDLELREQRAQELLDYLVNFMANMDVQVLQGNKVIEIKTGSVNKGTIGRMWLQRDRFDFVLAIGDDWTDEYLFAALPMNAYTIRVGLVESKAKANLYAHNDVLDLLTRLAGASGSQIVSH